MFQKKLISLLDLTSLNDTDTFKDIDALCKKAVTPLGSVAAICIYPQFIEHTKQRLTDKNVQIATVINFPKGEDELEYSCDAIARALEAGANEIDLVLPYKKFLEGKTEFVNDYLHQCRFACGLATLKVIIESGALKTAKWISEAASLAIQHGANFVKTSTGKIEQGATLDAAKIILETIQQEAKQPVGIKLSGGIRTVKQANEYLNLIGSVMGEAWISPETVRFGASRLLDDVLRIA